MKRPRIPEFFAVAWPHHKPVIRSSGLVGFLSDFYHMSVQRPYTKPPEFHFIRISINPKGVPSKLSNMKCLVVSSSLTIQRKLIEAFLSVRLKQDNRTWSPHTWSPIHHLMDFVSVVYQIMFQEMQEFLETRLALLMKMVTTNWHLKCVNGKTYLEQKFHGRVHPHRSKFQYLLLLNDQVEKSRMALTASQDDLRIWLDTDIYGISLASVPGAEWTARVQRLLTDVSHLISTLDELADRQDSLHAMVWHLSSLICPRPGH